MEVVARFWSGMSLHDELIQKIKQGMHDAHLTQCELSKVSGVPQGNISKILRGERPGTSLDTWDKLLRAVGKR